MLASSYGEHDSARELSAFAATALRGRNSDVRSILYTDLDRACAAMRDAYH